MQSHNITILGNGAMATVCAMLLEAQNQSVTIWGRDPQQIEAIIQTGANQRYLPGTPLSDRLKFTAQIEEAVADADIIFSAIPTQFIRSTWTDIAPLIPVQSDIVSVAKGIENKTLLRPTQILHEILLASSGRTDRPIATLSGPSIASELARCLPATVCVASDDTDLSLKLQSIMTTNWFRVYTNDDVLGVELAGAIKNVIALAAGIIDGLQAGFNAKSALLSRGLAEITRLGTAMGAQPDTFFGVTGIGDLATTCFSPEGRNRSAGELLGKGLPLNRVLKSIHGIVEGVPTTQSVMQLAQKYHVEMPITQAVYDVLFNDLDPIKGISQLMSRSPKPEVIG